MEPDIATATPASDPYISPYATAAHQPPKLEDPAINPGLAFMLGCIPGVGAIYNGQYAKGLIHVVVLGTLFSIVNHDELNGGFVPIFVLLIIGFWAYMPFEAYHTARNRQLGQPVDEFSSLLRIGGGKANSLAGPLFLIAAGAFFLLANFDLIRMRDVVRFWPLGLIALGAYMMYERVIAAKK